MPKAILMFRLPQEEVEHRMAMNGSSLYGLVWDIDQWLRNKLKHGNLPEERHAALQECRDELWNMIRERNLSLDD